MHYGEHMCSFGELSTLLLKLVWTFKISPGEATLGQSPKNGVVYIVKCKLNKKSKM